MFFRKKNHFISKKTIYLTFDDGPSKHTLRLLDILVDAVEEIIRWGLKRGY